MPIKLDPNRLDQGNDLEKQCIISSKNFISNWKVERTQNDLLQKHLMTSIVHLQEVDRALLKTE